MSPKNQRTMPIQVGARTDVGCVREQNEDSMLVKSPLLVVADGIGGQEAGEVASQIAVEVMEEEAPLVADAHALGEAVKEANRSVLEAASMGRGRPGMGTTLTAAVIDGSMMVVAQVGDSRCYRMRAGELEQLTHDHSLIASLIETGQITEEEAKTHPSRSIITKALGSDPDMVPDLFEFDVKKGDRIVLCSDGLYGMISKDELIDVLQTVENPQMAADKLVELAKVHGGMDNVTVIVANVDDVRQMSEVALASKKKRKWSVLVFAIVAVLLIGCAIGGLGLYVKNSAYLVSENGFVSLYKGRMDSLGPMDYKEFVRNTGVQTSKLPDITSQKLESGIQFDTLDEAESVVKDYESQVKATDNIAAGQSQAGTTASGEAGAGSGNSGEQNQQGASDASSASSTSDGAQGD